MSFNNYLKTNKKTNLEILKRVKDSIDNIYEEAQTPIQEVNQTMEDIQKSVKSFTDSFRYDKDGLKKDVSSLAGVVRVGSGIEKLKHVFSRFENPSMGRSSSASQQAMLMLLIYLHGIIKNFRASISGTLFEHYCAGLLGQTLATLPVKDIAEDIKYIGKGGKFDFSLKLISYGNEIKMASSNLRNSGYFDNPKKLHFLVGLKDESKLNIYIFSAEQVLIELAANPNHKKLIIPTGPKNPLKDNEKIKIINSFEIDINSAINIFMADTLQPAVKLIKQSAIFLQTSKKFFTQNRKPMENRTDDLSISFYDLEKAVDDVMGIK